MKQYLISSAVRENDDPAQDDESVSIVSNVIDENDEQIEQIQYAKLDENLFGICRKRTTTINKILVSGIEIATDKLENTELPLNSSNTIRNYYTETEPFKTTNKFKCAMFILFGAAGCYFSYKYIPKYIVSFRVYYEINNVNTFSSAYQIIFCEYL